MNELITCDVSGGILTFTLNRPDKLNALTNAMYVRLADLLFSAEDDPEIQVIVLTGGTRNFISGNELDDFLKSSPCDLDIPAFRFIQLSTRYPWFAVTSYRIIKPSKTRAFRASLFQRLLS